MLWITGEARLKHGLLVPRVVLKARRRELETGLNGPSLSSREPQDGNDCSGDQGHVCRASVARLLGHVPHLIWARYGGRVHIGHGAAVRAEYVEGDAKSSLIDPGVACSSVPGRSLTSAAVARAPVIAWANTSASERLACPHANGTNHLDGAAQQATSPRQSESVVAKSASACSCAGDDLADLNAVEAQELTRRPRLGGASPRGGLGFKHDHSDAAASFQSDSVPRYESRRP